MGFYNTDSRPVKFCGGSFFSRNANYALAKKGHPNVPANNQSFDKYLFDIIDFIFDIIGLFVDLHGTSVRRRMISELWDSGRIFTTT